MSNKIFDKKEPYNNRVKYLYQLVNSGHDLTASEKELIQSNAPAFYSLLKDITEKLAKSKKPSEYDLPCLLKCCTVCCQVFSKSAFKQITTEKFFSTWKTYLVPNIEPRFRRLAFEGLVTGFTYGALSQSEWQTSFFDCLNLAILATTESANPTDLSGDSPFAITYQFLELYFSQIIASDSSFASTLPLTIHIFEELYSSNNKINGNIHTLVATFIKSLQFSQLVHATKHGRFLDLLLEVYKAITLFFFSSELTLEQHTCNSKAFEIIFDMYVCGKFATDIGYSLHQQPTEAEKKNGFVAVSSADLQAFQEGLVIGIERIFFHFPSPPNDNRVSSVCTTISKIYAEVISNSSQLSEKILSTVCDISRTVVWRLAHGINNHLNESNKVMVSTLAISTLQLWGLFQKEDSSWDLLLQELYMIYDFAYFYKDFHHLFIGVSNRLTHILYGSFDIPSTIFTPTSSKLTAYKFDRYSTEQLKNFWNMLFKLCCNSVTVISPDTLSNYVTFVSDALDYFLIAERETKKTAFQITDVFCPFFISLLDDQTNIDVARESVGALCKIIIRPYNFPAAVYKTFSDVIQSSLVYSSTLSNSILPYLHSLYVYSLPLTSLMPSLLSSLLTYSTTSLTTVNNHPRVFSLLMSIALCDEQLNVKPPPQLITYVSHCFLNFLSSDATSNQAMFYWAVGTLLIQRYVRHHDFEYDPLYSILLKRCNTSPLTVIQTLLFIVRSLPTQQQLLDSIMSTLLTGSFTENATSLQNVSTLGLVEYFLSHAQLGLSFPEKIIQALSSLLNSSESSQPLDILRALLHSSFMHEHPSNASNSGNSSTSWWLVGDFLISITPLPGDEFAEILCRGICGCWRVVVSIKNPQFTTKTKSQVPTFPTIKPTQPIEFKQNEKVPHSLLAEKLKENPIEIAKLKWQVEASIPLCDFERVKVSMYIDNSNEETIQKTIDLLESEADYKSKQTEVEKNSSQKIIELIVKHFIQQPNESGLNLNNHIKYIVGGMASSKDQSSDRDSAVARERLKMHVSKIVEQLDMLGISQILPVRIYGNQTDQTLQSFIQTFVDDKHTCQIDMLKVIQVNLSGSCDKSTVIIWNDFVVDPNELTNAAVVLHIRMNGNLVHINVSDPSGNTTAGPLFDNMLIRSDLLVPFVKEAVIEKQYNLTENLYAQRLNLIKSLNDSVDDTADWSSYFKTISQIV